MIQQAREGAAACQGGLIIGDAIPSDRTEDTILRNIALYLGVHGVDLMEARTVSDVRQDITPALDTLHTR